MTRIAKIDRVMAELEQCREEHSFGAALGELDWLCELHRLLYEF